MPIKGFIDYQRREYCNDIGCPVQMMMNKKMKDPVDQNDLRRICQEKCLHTTYEFHHWLIEKGYLLVRPEQGGN